jgi:hypothetical protein
MVGWGDVFGKVFDWIPGRKETRANRIEKLEREQDELQKKPATPDNIKRMGVIADQLRILYAQSKNA